ncbi:MAG TPA: glycosyltransferase family 2 protein [Bacteroidia bacterium]|nr:glycosyltransferase family 2 protein [Bacteroidia bacterium]
MEGSDLPLISIGIPTYNRPEGLKRTLNCILSQTYTKIEVIVSDNASVNTEVAKILNEYNTKDPRIKFYIQNNNIGQISNFEFVLSKALGKYFIWAADDDEWQGSNFLTTLMKYAPENILTFPDAEVIEKNSNISYPIQSFKNCKTQLDYSINFCKCGWGYPLYGMFNMSLVKRYQLKFQFAHDLSYYMEGEFLHKLFLSGPTKYVKEAKIQYSYLGSEPSIDLCIDSWIKYYKRILMLYANSNLSDEIKRNIIKSLIENYTNYTKSLFEKLIPFSYIQPELDLENKAIKVGIFSKIFSRLKLALKVLLKGHY